MRTKEMYDRVEEIILGVVCSSCGGKLSAIDTVDNSGNPTVWSGCNECQKFDWGVKSEDFDLARRLIKETDYRPYTYDDMKFEPLEDSKKDYWVKVQTGGAYKMVYFINKYLKEKML